MRHLSDDELLDAAEGGSRRPAHLDACERCRIEAEELAKALREAATVQVPEPSPMFWEHFSARVHEGCAAAADQSVPADQKIGARTISKPWFSWRVMVGAFAVLALIVAVATFRRSSPAPPNVGVNAPPYQAAVPAPLPLEDVPEDESWRVLSTLAFEADPAGRGFGTPAPGVADDAMLEMSDEERGELIRLLKSELARGGVRSEG